MNVSHFSGPMNIGDGAYEEITATRQLTSEDSGKTLGVTAPSILTLPRLANVKKGFEITVRAEITPAGDYLVASHADDGAVIRGNIVTSGALQADSEAAGAATITFVSGSSVAGDLVTIGNNGINWYAYGRTAVAAGITFT